MTKTKPTLTPEQNAWLDSFEDLAGYRPTIESDPDFGDFVAQAERVIDSYGDYVRDELMKLQHTIPGKEW